MVISRLIEELEELKEVHGDVDVTMEGNHQWRGEDPFESTVETLIYKENEIGQLGKRVQLFWQM